MGDSQNHSWFLDNLLNQKRFQKTTVDAQKKAALDETPAEHGVLEDLHRGADLSEGEGWWRGGWDGAYGIRGGGVVALGGTVRGGLLRIGIVVESLNKSRPGLSHPWRLNGRTFPLLSGVEGLVRSKTGSARGRRKAGGGKTSNRTDLQKTKVFPNRKTSGSSHVTYTYASNRTLGYPQILTTRQKVKELKPYGSMFSGYVRMNRNLALSS